MLKQLFLITFIAAASANANTNRLVQKLAVEGFKNDASVRELEQSINETVECEWRLFCQLKKKSSPTAILVDSTPTVGSTIDTYIVSQSYSCDEAIHITKSVNALISVERYPSQEDPRDFEFSVNKAQLFGTFETYSCE